MKTYAIIANGVVSNVILWDGVSPLAPGIQAIDVTTTTPQPGVGWAYANSAFTAPIPAQPPSTPASVFDAAVTAGFDTGLGWKLALDEYTRNLITSGAALINSYLVSLQVAGNTTGVAPFMASTFTFVDMTGAIHTMPVSDALNLLIQYGSYYNTIWSAAQ